MSSRRSDSDTIRRLHGRVRMLAANATHWCPIVSSIKLREVLVNRCNEIGVSIEEVAEKADVSIYIFKKFYLYHDDPQSRPALRAEQLMKIGELIGVRIRVRTYMLDVSEIDRNKILKEEEE